MPINLLSGKMLESILERDGIDISVESNTLKVDVTNNRVGINVTNPDYDLDVLGSGRIDDVSIGVLGAGNISSTDLTLTATSNGTITLVTGSGLVDIQSSSAVQMPSGTTLERPGTPVAGMMRWNETDTELEFYDGTSWEIVGSGFVVVPTTQNIGFGDNVSTDFTLNKSTTTDAVLVILNGLVQEPVNAYTVTGVTLSFTNAPTTADYISVRFLI